MKRIALYLVAIAGLWATCCTVTYAGIIFVDAKASGSSPNGLSWQQAYTGLQDALIGEVAQSFGTSASQ